MGGVVAAAAVEVAAEKWTRMTTRSPMTVTVTVSVSHYYERIRSKP